VFTIKVEAVNLIFAQLQQIGTKYTFGCATDSEIPEFLVVVCGYREGNSCPVKARIWIPDKIFGEIPFSKLQEKYNLKSYEVGIFYLNDKSEGPRFSLYKLGPNLIEIQTYLAIATISDFTRELGRFVEFVKTVVDGLFPRAPEIVLHLRHDDKAPVNVLLGHSPDTSDEKSSKQSQSNTRPPANLGEFSNEEWENLLVIESPQVSFDDIGGHTDAKKVIQGLSNALRYPHVYQKWGTKPAKGVLLVGPPGNGKTLLAKALATEAEAKFLYVKLSDITTMWFGQSSKNLAAVFSLAREEKGPCIIFFDELDGLAPNRNQTFESMGRVVSTMLVSLDGMDSASNTMVLGATNRLDAIDPALKRAGRFDRIVMVPPPDIEGRRHIFKIHLAAAETSSKRVILDEIDLDEIVLQSEGMSGADISEVVRRVLEEKVRQEISGQRPSLVNSIDIINEINRYERNNTEMC
jgi:SpoVK/Ycf46/Vps4 family AAA+-type ATPase